MKDITLQIEFDLGALNTAYTDWSDACRHLQKAPDLESRLRAADEAHERFLAAQRKLMLTMNILEEAIQELKELREAANIV